MSPVDYVWKTFEVAHIYNIRGLYSITFNGFDERSYAEESHHITVFKMPCKVPKVKVELRGLSTVIPAMVQRLCFSINVHPEAASQIYVPAGKTPVGAVAKNT